MATRDPVGADRRYSIGTLWVNKTDNTSFQLTSVSGTSANWVQLGAFAGTSITVSGNITSTAGDIEATLGSVTAGTTVTAGTGVTATTGDITATAGNLVAGVGLEITEAGGGDDTSGLATLSSGTKVVASTAVAADSRIQLTAQTLGTVTAPVALAVTARSAGVSFTITSADNTDTSTVAWLIVNPA